MKGAPAGVWYKQVDRNDWRKLAGREFRGCRVHHRTGWLSTEVEHLAFDPAQPLDVRWRDCRGRYYDAGYYPVLTQWMSCTFAPSETFAVWWRDIQGNYHQGVYHPCANHA